MNFKSRSTLLCAAFLVVPMLLLTSCGGSDGGNPTGPGPNPNPNPNPTTGLIQVTTATTGDDLDPDGYMAGMDGNGERSIGLNGVTTFTAVATGQHAVELTGLAQNCSVAGANPVTATVIAGATAQVGFDVQCAFTTGSLEVTTTVTNNFDPDGYQVNVGGVSQGRVAVSGDTVFQNLTAGSQNVQFLDIAPNCVADGGNPVAVDIVAGDTATADFSVTCTNPPNGRIVFKSWNSSTGESGFSVMNADGSGRFILRHWPPEVFAYEAAWSPDGSRVAVELGVLGFDFNIWVMNKDGTDLTRLTTGDDGRSAWSPDGTWIAFVRAARSQSESNLWVVRADGSEPPRQLTDSPGLWDSTPTWSPDGSKIVYVQRPPGVSDRSFNMMDSDGSNITRLNNPAPVCDLGWWVGPWWRDGEPDWSPDGNSIVFERIWECEPENTTNGYDILVMNSDGSNVTNLTNSPGWEGRPRWSPDGNRIVFSGGNNDIWVMNADGTDRGQIGTAGTRPDWGP